MTTVSTTIKSKAFPKWLLGFTLLLSLLSFNAPASISGNVISAAPTEQQFFSPDNTSDGMSYLQHFDHQICAKNPEQQKNPVAGNTQSLRNFKTFTSLKFAQLLRQYSLYKSVLQFSACKVILLPAPKSRFS